MKEFFINCNNANEALQKGLDILNGVNFESFSFEEVESVGAYKKGDQWWGEISINSADSTGNFSIQEIFEFTNCEAGELFALTSITIENDVDGVTFFISVNDETNNEPSFEEPVPFENGVEVDKYLMEYSDELRERDNEAMAKWSEEFDIQLELECKFKDISEKIAACVEKNDICDNVLNLRGSLIQTAIEIADNQIRIGKINSRLESISQERKRVWALLDNL